MKKRGLLVLKVIGGFTVGLIMLTTGAAIVLNSNSVHQRLLAYATQLLEKQLQTRVAIDSINVDVWRGYVALDGLEVDDQQGTPMLEARRLAVRIDLWALRKRQVKVTKAEAKGIRGRLYTMEDGRPNYQFAIDALKKPKPTAKQEKKEKKPLELEVKKLQVADVEVSYDEKRMYLEQLEYHTGWTGHREGLLHHVEGQWQQTTRKGETRSNRLALATLRLKEHEGEWAIGLDSLHWIVDNHLPRKNVGKPHRGAFDAGHMDMTAHLKLTVQPLAKDSLRVALTQGSLTDSAAGLHIKDLRLEADIGKQTALLSDVTIQQEEATVLNIAKVAISLPSKKAGRGLTYQASSIVGRTLLKDIARPFSPALSEFHIPLELHTDMSGTDSTMTFSNIKVNTADHRLTLTATGSIDHLKDSKQLDIRFHVQDLVAKGTVALDIVNQFMVKKFMMKQLKQLGTLRYTGNVAILWRKEMFSGQLGTAAGRLDFDLTLDEETKYMSGHMLTHSAKLGKVLEMPDLADLSCRTSFRFDISKPRTAKMRQRLGGNLPIGRVEATVMEAGYKRFRVRNLHTNIESNGAVAKGHMEQRGKRVDLLCDFSFTSTDSIHKMKIRPTVKLHNMPWQKKDQATREAAKAQKQEQQARKQAEKARKKEEKAKRKAEKAARKQK